MLGSRAGGLRPETGYVNDMNHERSSQHVDPTTTDAGIPVASDEHSLTIATDGPILLQDHYLIEQMANFNRERVPERQPHAKGSGAFGYFEVTGDVSADTRAAGTYVRGSRNQSCNARSNTGKH
jgi:catalase